MKIKITNGNLKYIASDLKEKLLYNHISNITMINTHDLLFSFSMYRQGKLFVSLNHRSPFISFVNDVVPTGTIIGAMNDNLRKLVKDGNIQDIRTINNDRILAIDYTKLNDLYEKKNRTLIFELIPHRQNLIILEEGNIIYATHYTGIENERPLVKGLKYIPLMNKFEAKEEPIDLNELKKSAELYYLEAKQERNSEKYKALLTHIKSRIKSLKGKLLVLDRAIDKANKDLSYQEVGNYLLAYSYDKEGLEEYLKESKIDYDRSLSPGVNAEKYFKKYKKAKRTIEMDKIEIEKTHHEIEELSLVQKQIPYLKEEDLIEVSKTLFPHKFKAPGKKVPPSTYGCVTVEGHHIYYGKNAKQNDELTFKKAKRHYYFFHIKDGHGSHVIVDSENPSDELILTACEIALIMSGQEDGEIQYTQVKNIKKGSFLGQALLTSYQSIVLKSVRDLTKKLLINA
ncbi:MAG: NFACT RNA binding domain-containing protein [Bacilli bacterium]|nr:NFACT RNA binding domain-containing protein [Bacilli bacterium]